MRTLIFILIALSLAGILSANILFWNDELIYLSFVFLAAAFIFRGILYKKIIDSDGLADPKLFFTIFFAVYFGVGCVNISTYRGVIEPRAVFYILSAYIAFIAGTILGGRVKVERRSSALSKELLTAATSILLAVSFFAALYVISRYGFAFINTELRFMIRPVLLYGLLLSIAPSLIHLTYKYFMKEKITIPTLAVYFFAPVLILSSSGYRGYLIILFLALGIAAYLISKKSGRLMLIAGIILIFIFFSAGFYIMRDVNTYLMKTQDLYARYDFNMKYAFLAPFHFGFRETIGLFQKIINTVPKYVGYTKGELLFSDFMTILPGKQIAGGFLLKKILIGGDPDPSSGLTPSALGGLYLDFGLAGILAGFLIMGAVTAYFYKSYKINTGVVSVVNLAYIYSVTIHYIHRGIFAPYYLFLFIVIHIIFMISKKRLNPKY